MQPELHVMHLKVSIPLFIFSLLIAGCSLVPSELKTAERIMDTLPDSALNILHNLKPEEYKVNSDRALYGLLLSQALDKNDRKITPESLIDFSINYYLSQNDNPHLAACYYYKGHMFKHAQRYDEATVSYLKAIDCLQSTNGYALSGKIYADMGDICSIQNDYKESLSKYRASLKYLNRDNKKNEANYIILCIGRTNRLLKKNKSARGYYQYLLKQQKDSFLLGLIYQEMGINYYSSKQPDSAEVLLRKSLNFPFKGTNYSIRSYYLADLLFDKAQYDSSFQYASMALKYPANFYIQRECYRILVNVEYLRKDIHQMGKYMTLYQSCGDSIRKIESQTKCSVLEKLHTANTEANGSKKNIILILSLLILVLLLSSFVVVTLFKRNKLKKQQINAFKIQLNSKQKFVSQGLCKKIEDTKAMQAEERKNASVDYKEKLDRELYNNALHLSDWTDFSREMNHAFNNIIVTLKADYPTVNQKETIWCCLHLLDIPHADRMLMLDATSDSLYKLKQRLAQKLDLKSTKELDLFLKNITAIKV